MLTPVTIPPALVNMFTRSFPSLLTHSQRSTGRARADTWRPAGTGLLPSVAIGICPLPDRFPTWGRPSPPTALAESGTLLRLQVVLRTSSLPQDMKPYELFIPNLLPLRLASITSTSPGCPSYEDPAGPDVRPHSELVAISSCLD